MKKHLHNYYLSPDLKWGRKRVRYTSHAKMTSTHPGSISPSCNSEFGTSSDKFHDKLPSIVKPSSISGLQQSQRPPLMDEDDGIKEIKKKLLVHLRSTADKLRLPVVEKEDEDKRAALPPWNLRTRRAVCMDPAQNGTVNLELNSSLVSVPPPPLPPALPPVQDSLPKSKRRRGLPPPLEGEGNESRKKLRISLTREEIEEDFRMIMGSKRQRRRPMRRTKKEQRVLDAFFPGLHLPLITLDMLRRY